MRRVIAVVGFAVALAGAAASLVLTNGASRAANRASTFIIPASEGYGVADCLVAGNECGQVIANAWCEAQGFSRAESFGISQPEDVTGAVEKAGGASQPIAITCAN